MDWRVPFRWAKPWQPRNPGFRGFAADARSSALPHRVTLVRARACCSSSRACRVFEAMLSTTALGAASSRPCVVGNRARSALARPAGSPTFTLCGFTLIELLVVLAVVTVLAEREAQYLLDARAYASTAAALGYAATPADVAPYYTIGIAAPVVAPPAFTITATALGAQVADGGLTIDNQGTKTPSGKW